MDGEVGRFKFSTHSVIDRKTGIQLNTAVHLFPVLKPEDFIEPPDLKNSPLFMAIQRIHSAKLQN